MEPMADELKETIIRQHLARACEECPPDVLTADGLLFGKHQAKVIPFPLPDPGESVR